jgi:hypothetical protein
MSGCIPKTYNWDILTPVPSSRRVFRFTTNFRKSGQHGNQRCELRSTFCHTATVRVPAKSSARRLDLLLLQGWGQGLLQLLLGVTWRIDLRPRMAETHGETCHLWTNPHLLFTKRTQILKTRVRVKFWKKSDWPIWFWIDPLSKTNYKWRSHFRVSPPNIKN